MTAAARVDWLAQVKSWPVAEVAQRLGLEVVRRGADVSFQCPACGKVLRHERSGDRRRAAKVTPSGAGWWCEPCGAKGSAVDVVAWSTLRRQPDSGEDWASIRAACASLGLCDGIGGSAPGILASPPAPPPRCPLLSWPQASEVEELWSACAPLSTADAWRVRAWSFLERRGFDAEMLARLDGARVLPERFNWPEWWPGAWAQTWRLAVPAWSHTGAMVSLHARAIEPAQAKTRWPKGKSASGVVLADLLGVTFLREWDTPGGLAGLEAVVVAEGMTDTLKLSTVLERDESTLAVLGYVAGSVHAFDRIAWPVDVPMIVAVDDDDAGDKYVAELVGTLPPKARAWRVRPPQGRSADGKKLGDWSDLSDAEAAAALLDTSRWEVLP